jgi:hypothetical protein
MRQKRPLQQIVTCCDRYQKIPRRGAEFAEIQSKSTARSAPLRGISPRSLVEMDFWLGTLDCAELFLVCEIDADFEDLIGACEKCIEHVGIEMRPTIFLHNAKAFIDG